MKLTILTTTTTTTTATATATTTTTITIIKTIKLGLILVNQVVSEE
jgi:hypothetical protein